METNELLQYLLNYGANLISTGAFIGIGAKILTSIKGKMSSKAEAEDVNKLLATVKSQNEQIEALKSMNLQNSKQINELTNNVEELTQDVTHINKK